MRYGLAINGIEVILESDAEISVIVDYDNPKSTIRVDDSVVLVRDADLSPGWFKRLVDKMRESNNSISDLLGMGCRYFVGHTEAKEQTP